jgi:hypothetical protein
VDHRRWWLSCHDCGWGWECHRWYAARPICPERRKPVITEMLNHLQSAITHAIDLEAQINAPPEEWDDDKWEKAGEGFARELHAAVAAAVHEELIDFEVTG